MKFSQTVAGRLLRAVFGLYFMVAILVTLVELTGEYFHVRDNISREIQSLQKSFEPVLAKSLWRYDNDALISTLSGMQKLNVLVGIRI